MKNTVENGNKYNEVVLYREYEDEQGKSHYTMPNYIVCFDTVDEESKQESKRIAEEFGLEKPLPILLVHTDAYKERMEEFAQKHKAKSICEIRAEEIAETEELKEKINTQVEEILRRTSENVTLKGKITAMEELVSRFERNKENNDEIGT